nr:MAG TPA: hypothetical protein [Caudoviricetes sp.]
MLNEELRILLGILSWEDNYVSINYQDESWGYFFTIKSGVFLK